MFFFNIGSILGVARSSAEALSEALSEALLEARRLSDAPKSQGIALARDVDRSVFSQQTHQLGIYKCALCYNRRSKVMPLASCLLYISEELTHVRLVR